MFQSVIPIETGFAGINLLQLLTIGTSDNTALVCRRFRDGSALLERQVSTGETRYMDIGFKRALSFASPLGLPVTG